MQDRECIVFKRTHDTDQRIHEPYAGKGPLYTGFPWSLTDGYAMLMSPSKGETAVCGCHCPHDMAVRMRE